TAQHHRYHRDPRSAEAESGGARARHRPRRGTAAAGLDDTELVDFYRNRSDANLAIGRIKQALADAREAARLRPRGGGKFAYVMYTVAQAEQAAGHLGKARKIRERIAAESNNPAQRIPALFGLVETALKSGDLTAAQDYVTQSDQDLAEQLG